MSVNAVAEAPRAGEDIVELGLLGDPCSPHEAIKVTAADRARSEAINLGEDIVTPGYRGSSRRFFRP
jgi:hypothetical protein